MKGLKTGGRQKGSLNKGTADIRATVSGLVSQALTPEFFATLPPEKQADLIVKLLPYVIGKMPDEGQNDKGFSDLVINLPFGTAGPWPDQ
jgi:hypothetical protein